MEAESTINLKPVVEESDDSSTPPLPLRQRISQKLAKVRWRAFFTTSIIVIILFIMNSSISLIGVFFPAEALRKDVSLAVTGLIIAVTPLAITVFSPVTGYLLPKLKIPFSIITGLLLVGGTYIVLGLSIYLPHGSPFIIACLALRFIEGIGTALFLTAGYTMVTKLYPHSTGSVVGIVEVGAGLGYAFGPVIGGFLYRAGGYKLPFFAVGVLYFILAIPMFLILVYIGYPQKITKKLLHITTVIGLMKDFTILLLVLGIVSFHAGFGLVVTTYALFLRNKFGLTADKIGLIFFVNTLPYIICSPVAGKVADRINPRYVVISGLALTGLGYELTGPTPVLPVESTLWLSVIGIILTEVGAGQAIVAIFPTAFKIAMDRFPEQASSESERLKMMGVIAGMISTGMSFGEFIGPIIAGGLTDLTDFRTSSAVFGEAFLALMTVLLVVSLIDHYFTSRDKKYRKSEQSTPYEESEE